MLDLRVKGVLFGIGRRFWVIVVFGFFFAFSGFESAVWWVDFFGVFVGFCFRVGFFVRFWYWVFGVLACAVGVGLVVVGYGVCFEFFFFFCRFKVLTSFVVLLGVLE